jgi:transposase
MLDRESYMQKRLLVSLEHEQIAVEMRRQGSSVKAISEAIGLSVSATYTLIANHGARAR